MEGKNGGPPGDLYLQVSVMEHPIYSREGNDLTVEKEITFSEAVLGTTVEVPTLDGIKKVKVPPRDPEPYQDAAEKALGLPHFQREGRGEETSTSR